MVKDIRLSIKAEFFGVEWANSEDNDQDRFEGVITKWKSKKDEELYIRWDGWDTNRAARLDQLVGNDSNGEPLECKILSYADGRAAPVYQAPAAPAARQGQRQGADDGDDDDEDGEGEGAFDDDPDYDMFADEADVEKHGQQREEDDAAGRQCRRARQAEAQADAQRAVREGQHRVALLDAAAAGMARGPG